ncbi:MAG: hypothetical protein M3R06_02810 [Chloroflexota bacterium]|nr:hypothetical protein [Chloroflexota bacterium]
MTRNKTYLLTAVAAILYALLCWMFADGLFDLSDRFLISEDITGSALWTYLFLAAIVVAGVYQAQRLPAEGVAIRSEITEDTLGQVHDPAGWRLLIGNVYLAILWLPLRFFVGQEWLAAGEPQAARQRLDGRRYRLGRSWSRGGFLGTSRGDPGAGPSSNHLCLVPRCSPVHDRSRMAVGLREAAGYR